MLSQAFPVFVFLVLMFVNSKSYAIRPFVTDDARVVGDRIAQVETWAVFDNHKATHNALFAIGPTPWLELTSGLSQRYSFVDKKGYGISGGLLQLKALLRDTKPDSGPGVSFSVGVIPAFGSGSLTPDGVTRFEYGILSQSFFNDDLLFHANLGASSKKDLQQSRTMTAGFGFQARVIGGLHAVAEIYRGDPYDPTIKVMASQVGFRHIFSDTVQIDGTIGSTFDRHAEQWMTIGIRVVSPKLW
ncbi:MAG: hypothetical protein M3P47_02820 [Pseudomonadota bacterium]|nr:hypothetical protein [Pseudomonadota bacterium]